MRLDAETIKTLELPLGKTDAIFFDDDLIGFGIRLRSNGGRLRRSWIAQYRAGGRTRRFKIGVADRLGDRDVERIRHKAFGLIEAVRDGKDPQGEKTKKRRDTSRLLRSVAAEYLETKKFEMAKGEYRPSSYRVTKLYLTHKRYFGSLHSIAISEIGLSDVAARTQCDHAEQRKCHLGAGALGIIEHVHVGHAAGLHGTASSEPRYRD